MAQYLLNPFIRIYWGGPKCQIQNLKVRWFQQSMTYVLTVARTANAVGRRGVGLNVRLFHLKNLNIVFSGLWI